MMKHTASLVSRTALVALALATIATPSWAQMLTGAPADPAARYSTPMPVGVATPDSVQTRIGTLRFTDGFPDGATAEAIFDNLDFQRAVQAYLLALPPVSQASNRNAIRALGPVNGTLPMFEQLIDSRSIFLTANDNTV